jgi:hypothetical protein
MHYEPGKRSYYRFPSTSRPTNGVNDFDSEYYFPEKPRATNENIRFESKSTASESKHED